MSFMKKAWFLHPILFAITPIIFLYSHNIEEVKIIDTLFPIVVSLILGIIGGGLLFVLLRSFYKASILTSFGLMLFFSYGHIFELTKGLKIGSFTIGRTSIILSILLLFFVLVALFVIRSKKDMSQFTQMLNIGGLVLLLTMLPNIVIYSLSTSNYRQVKTDFKNPGELGTTQQTKPDIYYIILDGYARQDVLQEQYFYDNTDFLKFLRKRGFFVADRSNSNYTLTYLSLASSLNMMYLDSLYSEKPEGQKDRSVPYGMINDNAVSAYLKSNGYKVVNFSSGWGPTNFSPKADYNFATSLWNEFTMIVIKTSMFSIIYKRTKVQKEIKIIKTLNQLASLDFIKEPKFVFAHIVCPHPPYLFDRNGNPVPTAELSMEGSVWLNKSGYLNQLLYINKRMQKIIDSLLSTERNPMIILQADHGTASSLYGGGSSTWENPDKKSLKERLSILNAYRFPDGSDMPQELTDSISPVNTFRVVFNSLFGTQHDLLPNKAFFQVLTSLIISKM
jgi:hypothetical protein